MWFRSLIDAHARSPRRHRLHAATRKKQARRLLVEGLEHRREFQTAVEEIFDVQLLPGLRFPEVIGFQHETINHIFEVQPT